ncbi:Origin recognition complex subunit 5 [Gryganskiella cystojenkinii]|nr:Origin recognition complex subunit 5 [Gryganskiella cystojenkinii]
MTREQQLQELFPGRAKQINQILSFMGQPWAPTPPSLLVNGNSSVGKTAVIKTIFSTVLGNKGPSRYAFLDCVECHTPRLLFEHAIYQFKSPPKSSHIRSRSHVTATDATDETSTTTTTKTGSRKRQRPSSKHQEHDTIQWERCENVNEFVEWCRRICDQNDNENDAGAGDETESQEHPQQRPKGVKDTRYLVLDRAERLRDTAPSLIPVLMRLQELTGRNICVILITTIVWEKFRSKTGGYEPIILHFPQYSKQETIAILQRDMPVGEDAELFMRFVDLVYDVFQRNCKDLNEIRHLVALLFPLYVKPVKEGKIQRHEGLKLHRHIQAYFVEAMDKIYLREISSMEWSDRTMQAAAGQSRADPNDPSSTRIVIGAPGSERAMMTATSFILIASFLASYNPPRLDMRYFAKVSNQGGKMTKRQKVAAAKKHGHDNLGSKLRQQLLGPKTFPIERMLAIFYSILNEEAEETVHVHTQIASLVSLRLLQRVTPMDKLDSIKCKCNVSYETIKALAKSTKFDIDKYLYDFTRTIFAKEGVDFFWHQR